MIVDHIATNEVAIDESGKYEAVGATIDPIEDVVKTGIIAGYGQGIHCRDTCSTSNPIERAITTMIAVGVSTRMAAGVAWESLLAIRRVTELLQLKLLSRLPLLLLLLTTTPHPQTPTNHLLCVSLCFLKLSDLSVS